MPEWLLPADVVTIIEEIAIEKGILPLLQCATFVQTFGQWNHVCLKDGSTTIPPYAPPQKIQSHLIPPDTPRSIFVYFPGLFYDDRNDTGGGCIPVIIADDIVLPFADAIPWEDFGLFIAEKNVPYLDKRSKCSIFG
ncbi:hypothetical protein HAX54_033307 [Datura stramonium]|uniref:Exostosin GT47 domain-containing protein n=1 Tax=Datura stramonium TaxID=4076 RepID=A0ABS8SD93_DATST|nr:hypothetical protein [Datura stramonium]